MNEMFQKEEVLPYMKGLWREALQSICGLQSGVFNKKHQPCPYCGGKDRFRWTDELDSLVTAARSVTDVVTIKASAG